MGQDKTTNTRTRAPGLDGVRAVAVLAVMGFHEGASELSGGFLGVDVFFVLSGFLITDLLVAQYDQSGRVDLKNFWARRARRLLPPLAVMLVVVSAAAAVIEPTQEASLRLALLAAATYTSNWYQILHHVSYFATFGPLPPLDHLWSLAIEEQFYLVWPVVLWFGILKLNGQRARVTATLLGVVISAAAMALVYTPGNPSLVYYGTDTHAFALLIGAALALTCPLATLTSASAAHMRRLDAAGVIGLAVLAWAAGHFSGSDPAVYPVGLMLAAVGAAGLVAAAASNGVIASMTSLRPLRWLGIRSYGVYLWHWPVIALVGALVGRGFTSPWLWLIETCVAIVLACLSWHFIETPILQNGFRATCRHWWRLLVDESLRPVGARRHVVPTAVAAATLLAVAMAGYGVARPPTPTVPTGLLRQVAEGQRISSASRAARPAQIAPTATVPQESPAPASVCRPAVRPAKVFGWQVTAVGDSVMVASAAALESAMPGIYIDARVGLQMSAGLAVIQGLAASGALRQYVVVGLGTNGTVTAAQIRQLRRVIGLDRDLILVNTFGPMSWESADNAVLDAAARHGSHVDLANWHQAIAKRTYLLWPDGIHPRPSGARVYAHVLLAAVQAELPHVQAPVCDQSAKGPR